MIQSSKAIQAGKSDVQAIIAIIAGNQGWKQGDHLSQRKKKKKEE